MPQLYRLMHLSGHLEFLLTFSQKQQIPLNVITHAHLNQSVRDCIDIRFLTGKSNVKQAKADDV